MQLKAGPPVRLYLDDIMRTVADFLDMGGYAAFVWPAYGVAAAIMLGLCLTSLRAYRQSRRELDLLQQDRPTRASRSRPS